MHYSSKFCSTDRLRISPLKHIKMILSREEGRESGFSSCGEETRNQLVCPLFWVKQSWSVEWDQICLFFPLRIKITLYPCLKRTTCEFTKYGIENNNSVFVSFTFKLRNGRKCTVVNTMSTIKSFTFNQIKFLY